MHSKFFEKDSFTKYVLLTHRYNQIVKKKKTRSFLDE